MMSHRASTLATAADGVAAGSLARPASSRSRWTRLAFLLAVAAALGGWAVGLVVFGVSVVSQGGVTVGGDLSAYLRAGDDLLAGRDIYWGQIGVDDAFHYAPPWAVLFAALAWVPDLAMQWAMMALGVLSIRYVAGSWLWAGLVFWYPVSVMVLLAGNIEFLIAGAIVLAARGHAGPLAFTALAKFAPAFAIPPKAWRQAALVVAIAVLVTLPWLELWPAWVENLLRQPTQTAFHFGPPWYLRLPFALALLLLRRPWARALAVVVATPAFWLGSAVVLIAAIRLWVDERQGRTAG